MPKGTSSPPSRRRTSKTVKGRSEHSEPSRRHCCSEVNGKTIAYLRYVNSEDWKELEIHFTDKTFLSLEFGFHLQLKAEHLKFSKGRLEQICSYGILCGEQPFGEDIG